MPLATLTAPDPQALARDAIRSVTALATLPEVTARIIATVEDPRSSAANLHKIISHDPALVTRILKLVNSAFYGLPGQVGSIDRAIVLLGLNAVKNIAIAASLGQLFRGVKLCDKFSARDLWTHCIAVAVAGRELAKGLKLPLVDEAFLGGMIHDSGILISLQAWPEKTRSICNSVLKSGGNFCQAEQQGLGLDHQTLGQALAEQWKFPASCRLVAGSHHNPTTVQDDSRLLVTLVYVADTICCQIAQGFNLTAQHQQLDSALLAEVKIEPALIEQVKANLPAQVSAAAAVFG
ncbi:MAG: HDOD domain-containing protein [Tepidisphaeraceae bacterium]|jgi:HD-like signal output (HDOD) protein